MAPSAPGRCAAAVAALLLQGCWLLGSSDGGGGGDDSDERALALCPRGEPHLLVGERGTQWDVSSRLVRLTSGLRRCKGFVLDQDRDHLWSVGGTASGADLLGLGGGEVLLVDGAEVVWEVSRDHGHRAAAVFSTSFQGEAVVVVLWVDTSGNGQELDVLRLDDGSDVRTFDVSSSVKHAAPSVDGSVDRVGAISSGTGVQQYRLDPGADSLALTGERQVAAPLGTSPLNWLDVTGPDVTVASGRGVLYWRPDLPDAFLGPVGCRRDAAGEGPVLEGDAQEYVAATVDDSGSGFLAAASGTLADGEGSSSVLLQLEERGRCRLVYESGAAREITSLAWSGR